MNDRVLLKRTSPKPYPTKGAYAEDNWKTPATHACILLNHMNFYEVNVWDMRKNSNLKGVKYYGDSKL